ncbi:hypothetical protein HY495_00575 [Candidatus Woesearchaeota archaeon]|nr:hypothetical protein [Candidatus Woesearchaeota archaeon]
MVRKVKQNIPRNRIFILVASVLVLAVLIGVLYPLVKEQGVAGKAVAAVEQPAKQCGVSGSVVAYSSDLSVLCTDKNKGVICDPKKNLGFIQNINGQFDVRCSKKTTGEPFWMECNADGTLGGSGKIVPVAAGAVSQGNTLCAQNGKYESWFVCPLGSKVGKDGVDDQALVQTENGDFLCSDAKQKWLLCDKPLQNQDFFEKDGKTVLFYCQEEAGELKWSKCSYVNLGKMTNNKFRYCDGSEWKKCDASSLGVSPTGQFYCASGSDQKWQECNQDTVKNSFSSDYKALCKDGAWQMLPEAATPPPGYAWEVAPVVQSSVGTGTVILNKVRQGPIVQVVGNSKYYCPSTQYCPGASYKTGEQDTSYCYEKNSLSPQLGLPARLCTLEKNSQGDDEGVWRLCSNVLPQEYKLYNEKYLCVTKPNKAFWDKCDQDKVSGDNNEYYCDGTTWTECTSAREGMASTNDNYLCINKRWTSHFVLHEEEIFETKVEKGGKAKMITNSALDPGLADVATLCDTGTENVQFKATLCDGTAPPKTLTVSSLSFLRGSNQPLTVQNDLLYTYAEVEPKTVSVHAIVHPETAAVTLAESVLANNFAHGRRLAVEVDGQYYLLVQSPAGPLNLAALQLISLPSEEAVPVTALASDKYQFEIQAKKVLTLTYDGTKIVIAVGKPTEALAGQVTQHTLAGEYEVSFSKKEPILLQDFGGTKLVPCLSDKPNDPLTLQVCLTDESQKPFVTLQRDVLTETKLLDIPVALLYQWDLETNSKQASIFYLKQLDGSTAAQPTELVYEDFVDNLVTGGKGVALSFAGDLYLMSHGGKVLSLPLINLTAYTDGSITLYSSGSQSEKTVDFLVEGGMISLTRGFTAPPPPFTLSVQTTEELLANPLDLVQELSTSFSSQVPVMITSPINYGILGQDTTSANPDVLGFKPLFKVKGDATGQAQLALPFQKPLINGRTLLYYYGAELKEGELIKTARVFHYFNLTDKAADSQAFDDQFLDMFMGKGKEIALGLGNGYYVLSYAGATPEQKSFYEFEQLQLASLDGTQKITPTVDELQASFAVPQGTIMVSVDQAVTKMTFTKKGAQEIAKEAVTESFDPAVDYKYTLVPGKIVNVAGDTYEICDKGVFLTVFDRVRLCKNGDFYKTIKGKEFLTENNVLIYYSNYDSELKQKSVILEKYVDFSASKGGATVTNDQFFSLPPEKMGLGLKWNDKWYEFGSNGFISLSSAGYCAGNLFTVDVEKMSSTGYIICTHSEVKKDKKDKIVTSTTNLLRVEKEIIELTGDVIYTITPTTFKLASSVPVEVKDIETFFEPAGEKSFAYVVKVTSGKVLADVVFSVENNVIFKASLPEGVTRAVLLPNSQTIKVTVVDLQKNIITVST